MKLFDKLIEKTKQFLDKTKLFGEHEKPLFESEAVKMYYEIIYGMSKCVDSIWLSVAKAAEIVKRYIESQTSDACNESEIQTALELFEKSRGYDKSELALRLKEYNKELEEKDNYVNKDFDIITLCYANELALIKNEYKKFLDTCAEFPTTTVDNPTFPLESNIKEHIIQVHSKTIGEYEVTAIINKVIRDSFYEGNELTQRLLTNYLYYTISERRVNRLSPLNALKIVALRAVHFEQHGGNRENYITLSDDEIRDFALRDRETNKKIANDPLGREKIRERFINDMHTDFLWSYDRPSVIWTMNRKDYFVDSLCNLAWKESIRNRCWKNADGVDITDSKDIIEVSDMIASYFYTVYVEKKDQAL